VAKQIRCEACSVYPNVVYHPVGDQCPRVKRGGKDPVTKAEVVFTPAIPAPTGGLEQVIIEAIKPHLSGIFDWGEVVRIAQTEARAAGTDWDKVAEVARAEARAIAPVRVEVARVNEPPKDMGVQHAQFPRLLRMLQSGLNVWLVGPAGTGKTVAAESACDALGLPYFRAKSVGPTTAEYDLLGYNNAAGAFVHGAFYETYKNGGVLLIDEIDSASGDALIAINSALANGFAFFGDERVNKHADFRCIAAANTVGQGRDSVYIGRSQIDGATLDRFDFLRWGYDAGIEESIVASWRGVSNEKKRAIIDEWYDLVLKVREVTESLDIRIPISTRAIIDGCKFIVNANATLDECANMRFWERMSTADAKKIKSALKGY
jgi:cobaltochelatase CobS